MLVCVWLYPALSTSVRNNMLVDNRNFQFSMFYGSTLKTTYDYFSLYFIFLCNSDCIHFSWAHINYLSSSSALGEHLLFWRGKWAINVKTRMQRFNFILGYYRFTSLSTSFMSLVLVIDIITIFVIWFLSMSNQITRNFKVLNITSKLIKSYG